MGLPQGEIELHTSADTPNAARSTARRPRCDRKVSLKSGELSNFRRPPCDRKVSLKSGELSNFYWGITELQAVGEDAPHKSTFTSPV